MRPHRPDDPQARPRALAFYLPQYHPIAENDAWWGQGFTEWTGVAGARPLFEGHEQPHLPADLGFYDLRLTEVRQAQADLARAHGIDGFVYYHYWSLGRRLLERPFADVLASGRPDFPFALCWANEDWRARWDGGSGELLWAQQYSEADDAAHIDYLVRCFADRRYVRVDGKPLFLVYRAASLPAPPRFAAELRRAAAAAGVGEVLLCRVESGFGGERGDPADVGFDAAVEFQPDWLTLPLPDRSLAPHTVMDYAGSVAAMLGKPTPAYRRLPCVTPRWDNTPRRPDDATILRGSTPELYRRWLSEAADTALRTADDPVVFINAWNEWGEGAHLEPDQQHGHGYLLAHAGGIAGGSPLADVARPAMAEHHTMLADVITQAERAAIGGDDEEALRLAQAAAEWAWLHHTGRLASERLERLLRDLALRHVPPQRRRAAAGPRRVLHVLTHTDGLRGHTQQVSDWIRIDDAGVHSVVVTGQATAVPAGLRRAAAASGGEVQVLMQASLLERVSAVAAAAADADLVILHTHPFETVATAALAHPTRPVPTVLVNRAHERFWLGVGAADLIAEVRPSGAWLTLHRRGVGAGRQVRLPQPLPPLPTRAAARRSLGVPDDAGVVSTLTPPGWGAPGTGVVMAELISDLLAERADFVVLVGGTSAEDGGWSALRDRFGDRLRLAAAPIRPPDVVAAADVHVDAHPRVDTAPLLLAGAADVPVVLFGVEELEGSPLGFDDFHVDGALLTRPASPAAWRSSVIELLDDRALRGQRGAAMAEAVSSGHGDGAFLERLAALQQMVEQVEPGADRLPRPVDVVPTGWQDVLTMVEGHSETARPRHGFSDPISTAVAGTGGDGTADFSVLVWSHRGGDALVRCLTGVLEGCADDGVLDVVVLHDGAPDVAAVLRALRDDVRGVLTGHQDSGAGPWARGLGVARSRKVLLITDDVACPPGLLARCRQVHRRSGPRSAVLVRERPSTAPASTAATLSADAGVCLFADRAALMEGALDVVEASLNGAVATPSGNHVLCIAGMHRSHTSVCARWLQECGLQIHNGALLPGGDGNEGGHFEDLEFHALHSAALRRRWPHSDGWRVEGSQALSLQGAERSAAHELIRARNARYRVWGWKDPRTVLFLDDWRSILPGMKVLGLWRREDEVVRSLVRRSSSENRELAVEEGLARSLWRGHNEILRRYRAQHPDSTLLVDSAHLFADDRPIFEAVNALLDGALTYVSFRAVADVSRQPRRVGGSRSELEQALAALSFAA